MAGWLSNGGDGRHRDDAGYAAVVETDASNPQKDTDTLTSSRVNKDERDVFETRDKRLSSLFPPIDKKMPTRGNKRGQTTVIKDPLKSAKNENKLTTVEFEKNAERRNRRSRLRVVGENRRKALKHWARLRGIFAPQRSVQSMILQAFMKKRLEEVPRSLHYSEYEISLRNFTIPPGTKLRSLLSAILIIAFLWNFFVVIFQYL